jgi:hypothetical protein
MGMGHLERLRHIRRLLTAQGRHGAATARLLRFSGAGFTAELAGEAARSGDIRLLTPADLYTGILLPTERQILVLAPLTRISAAAWGRRDRSATPRVQSC